MPHITITGFAWMPSDIDGLADKIPVGESGPMHHMLKTLVYYAENSIRCEFSISTTED